MRYAAILLGGLLTATGTLIAQTTPSFEVASVKPNVSSQTPMYIQLQPGGVIIQNMPLRAIIEWAYQLQRDDDRLVGAPDWIATERFDIMAKAPAGPELGTLRRVSGVEIDLTGGVKVDPNGAGLLTALREQLGLKLESTRGPVEVFVVDRVERPTPD
jgi:hypothetical protein